MTFQMPDNFINNHARLTGLEYRGHGTHYIDLPSKTYYLLSNCYRGFVATFRLNANGSCEHLQNEILAHPETPREWKRPPNFEELPLIDYAVMATGQTMRQGKPLVQIVENGIIGGDFQVCFRAVHRDKIQVVNVLVPFENGVVSEDFTRWRTLDTICNRSQLNRILESWEMPGHIL